MLHNTPAGPHPANRIRPYHAGMGGTSQPPYRHTTATFSIIPTHIHIHTPIGVQSLAPATSPHPTWLQGTNGHHAPNDTLASCTPPNAHILNPHTGKWPSPHQAPAACCPLSHYHPLPLTLTDRPSYSYSCWPIQDIRSLVCVCVCVQESIIPLSPPPIGIAHTTTAILLSDFCAIDIDDPPPPQLSLHSVISRL